MKITFFQLFKYTPLYNDKQDVFPHEACKEYEVMYEYARKIATTQGDD